MSYLIVTMSPWPVGAVVIETEVESLEDATKTAEAMHHEKPWTHILVDRAEDGACVFELLPLCPPPGEPSRPNRMHKPEPRLETNAVAKAA